MNERVKKLWIEALTSGEYEQGTDALRTDDMFCCLGVLCDLHRKEVGGSWQDLDGLMFTYDNTTGTLPPRVQIWADTPTNNPFVGRLSLAGHNDKGVPFSEIAKLIEANL